MMAAELDSEQIWAQEQIKAFRLLHVRYERMAQALQQILEKATRQIAPLAIIQTRPKSIPSFTEKAIRKKKAGRYSDPLARMTDLCGGRVITQTLEEVRGVCSFIEDHFVIDAANSVDVSQRLKPSEFGYRSVHYIVQFKPGVFPEQSINIEVPQELYPDEASPMKAEIQVRTVLEHGWAGFVHDRVYKSAFTVPPKWERELAVLAGMLEQTDRSFARVQYGLRTYAANYGAYLNENQLKDEIGILETVLTCDPNNVELAHRIGRLAMEMADWQKAIDIFTKYESTSYQPILRDLGVVLCKVNASDVTGQGYRRGQKYLDIASAPPYKDSDALASLAGTWKKIDEEKTRSLYRQAFEVDPTDPYAVSNYLVYEIVHQRDLAPANLMFPTLAAAIQRSLDQVEVGMNMPWAFYNLGIFHLLLRQPYESLIAYAQAICASSSNWVIETSQRLLDKLAIVKEQLTGFEWIRRELIVGSAARFHEQASLEAIREMATPAAGALKKPVVILAGGTREDTPVEGLRSSLIDGFRDYRGTLISGGTAAGVAGLAGEIQANYPDSIMTIGFVPAKLPEGVKKDIRYRELRSTGSQDFSALEPLQYWIDLLASGVSPTEVKLVGFNGGEITSFEYRLALVLGAKVGVVESSGREAARIFKDADWARFTNLNKLRVDEQDIQGFLAEP